MAGLSVDPDALFGLKHKEKQDGQNTSYFFVEIVRCRESEYQNGSSSDEGAVPFNGNCASGSGSPKTARPNMVPEAVLVLKVSSSLPGWISSLCTVDVFTSADQKDVPSGSRLKANQ